LTAQLPLFQSLEATSERKKRKREKKSMELEQKQNEEICSSHSQMDTKVRETIELQREQKHEQDGTTQLQMSGSRAELNAVEMIEIEKTAEMEIKTMDQGK